MDDEGFDLYDEDGEPIDSILFYFLYYWCFFDKLIKDRRGRLYRGYPNDTDV